MKKLSQMRCAECGAEVLITFSRPNTTFRINEEGHIVHYDNSLEGCELMFHCSDDMGHLAAPPSNTRLFKIWEKWSDEVEEVFYDKHMEEIF